MPNFIFKELIIQKSLIIVHVNNLLQIIISIKCEEKDAKSINNQKKYRFYEKCQKCILIENLNSKKVAYEKFYSIMIINEILRMKMHCIW